MALRYHAGQIEVQTEANSRPAADMLAERLGGRSERVVNFYASADLVVLATSDGGGRLRFHVISGPPPLLSPGEANLLRLSESLPGIADGAQAGAIAIDLRQRRRARANGRLLRRDSGLYLDAAEEIINCRKYIAPSVAVQDVTHGGPVQRAAIDAGNPRLLDVLARCETAFLASVNPEGQPDVSHKGGPPGFLSYDPSSRALRWPELIGNGMLKSAGNVRATGSVSLLALDLDSGDAYELSGRGEFRTELRYEQPRETGLWPAEQDYPVQGSMAVSVDEVALLRSFILPRRRLESEDKVTSCSPVELQVPR